MDLLHLSSLVTALAVLTLSVSQALSLRAKNRRLDAILKAILAENASQEQRLEACERALKLEEIVSRKPEPRGERE